MKLFLKILFVLVLLLLIGMGLGWYYLNDYLSSTDRKVFDQLKPIPGATVSFGEVELSWFKDFPKLTVVLNDFMLQDSVSTDSTSSILSCKELDLGLNLSSIWEDTIQIQQITFRKGQFNRSTDDLGYQNLKSIFPIPTQVKNDSSSVKPPRFKLQANPIVVILDSMHVVIQDERKNQRLSGLVNNLTAALAINGRSIAANCQLDLEIDQLAFNAEKGSYLDHTHFRGDFNALINSAEKTIKIAPFQALVDHQSMLAEMQFDLKPQGAFRIDLENHATDFAHSRGILTKQLQKVLAPYKVDEVFYSKTKIIKPAGEGKEALIEIAFDIPKTMAQIREFPLPNTLVKGRFINRFAGFNKPENPNDPRGIYMEFDELETNHQGVRLKSKKPYIRSSKKTGLLVGGSMQASGRTHAISKFFGNDKFFFDKGRFEAEVFYEGPYTGAYTISLESVATLKITDFEIEYRPAAAFIPVDVLILHKSAEDSEFWMEGTTFGGENHYTLDGILRNFPALILEDAEGRAETTVRMNSERVGWADFIALFGQEGLLAAAKAANAGKRTESLKSLLAGIEASFSPEITLVFDTIAYSNDLILTDFRSGAYFKNASTLILEATDFNFRDGAVSLDAELELSRGKYTPFQVDFNTKELDLNSLLPSFNYFNNPFLKELSAIPDDLELELFHMGVLEDHVGLLPNSSTGEIVFSIHGDDLLGKIAYEPVLRRDTSTDMGLLFAKTQIELVGEVSYINEFFKSDEFFFEDGRFSTEINYSGNVATREELISNSNSDFSIDGAHLYYKAADVVLPLDELQLNMLNGDASFYVRMNNDSLNEDIIVSGELINANEVFLKDDPKGVSALVDIQSDRLVWSDFLFLFGSASKIKPKESKQNSSTMLPILAKETTGLKRTAAGLVNTFNPTVSLRIDTLVYNDKIELHQLRSDFSLAEESILSFYNSGFEYKNGLVKMDASIDLRDDYRTPFRTQFETNEIEIADLLLDFNHFGIPALSKIKRIAGEINLYGDFQATLIDTSSLDLSTALGLISFDLQNAELTGFKQLEDIGAKIYRKKRFEEIRFSPISNLIEIKGPRIIIPEMGIQSTAADFFIEGYYGYEGETNMWVSIPLRNIYNRSKKLASDRLHYAESGKKVFVQLYTDENGYTKSKFRLSKKKYYEEKGISEEFKKDRKRFRKLRRANRKRKREERRIAKKKGS